MNELYFELFFFSSYEMILNTNVPLMKYNI